MKITILHEDVPQWRTLQMAYPRETWEISQHSDGDVEISCNDEDSTKFLFLKQDELKQVIAFLQTKVKA